MKLKQTSVEGQMFLCITGTGIRVHWDTSLGKDLYCANFDKCTRDEEDLFASRYDYHGDYTEDSRDVLNEIKHFMEWFIGFSRNSIELAEIRTSYKLALDGKA